VQEPGEPKLIKGWLGWAAVGQGVVVYARTRKEALLRYNTRVVAAKPSADKIIEDVHDLDATDAPVRSDELP
jgi:hypothetical protein